jgi:RimJ/RimL family protein N-acetyltransferase
MELILIKETLEENDELLKNPVCFEIVTMTIEFYKKVGFLPPWVGYFARQNNDLVGSAGFKGPPIKGRVEIAYGTFEEYRKRGIGTAICKLLIDFSLKKDPSIKITARTISEENFSTRVLQNNNFRLLGTVMDPEDGEVWEWLYAGED